VGAAEWFDRVFGARDPEPAETAVTGFGVEQRAVTELPWNYGGTNTYTAPPTQDAALQLEPVFSAWRLLANGVASLPLHTYRKTGTTRKRIDTPKLFDEPSAVGTLYDWLFRAVVSLCSSGNAVGLVTGRDALEYPTGVEWLDPRTVRVEGYAQPDWFVNGQPVPRENVVHIPWFPMPGQVWGLSPLGAYAFTISAGTAKRGYITDWFDSGGVPSGTFRNTEKKIDAEQAGEIKRRLVNAIATHAPIVFGHDWEYNPLSIAPHEAQFIDSMRLDATQIASIYGVSPEDIGGHTGASLTYSTVELNQIKFNTVTLRPWVTKLEQAFYPLLPRPQYVKFNMDATVRADIATRYATYAIAKQHGLLTTNEIRQLEDRDPVPGGDEITLDPDTVTAAPGSGGPSADQPPAPAAGQPARLRPVADAGSG